MPKAVVTDDNRVAPLQRNGLQNAVHLFTQKKAKRRRDHYLLTRCLRKYGDFLRYEGHLQFAKVALMEALRLSARGRGSRQRIYVLGCLGDLERQQQNYAAALDYFERAIELARSTFIPGWLGNLHLGLAHLAIERRSFDEARTFIGQAEAFYRSTHPRHWWGSIQVELGKIHLMREANELGWMERARAVQNEALSAINRLNCSFDRNKHEVREAVFFSSRDFAWRLGEAPSSFRILARSMRRAEPPRSRYCLSHFRLRRATSRAIGS